MNVALAIRQRLGQVGLDQRELAIAARVTESYISQLLAGKKSPPAPDRTDIYEKMEEALKLPSGELVRLAGLQRREELKKKLGDETAPLFKQVRELILRKCNANKQTQVRAIFENQPFGELERLVTQKLLDVVKSVVKKELENEDWLRLVSHLSNRSYEQMRVFALEFLDSDVFSVSDENCASFLDPLIESWDVDLATFGLEIAFDRKVVEFLPKKFEFVEVKQERAAEQEPGLKEFLNKPAMSGDATEEEIEFLKGLRFHQRRPTALYFYRELQSLRDPLHFRFDSPK